MNTEQLSDKLMRRITARCGGWVIEISQRRTRAGIPPKFGPWFGWGEVYDSLESARAAHDKELAA